MSRPREIGFCASRRAQYFKHSLAIDMSISPNHRNTIDQEVYKWVAQQGKRKKLVTPNAIRQRAYEIGQEYDPNFKASLNWYNNWKKRYEYNESPEAEALKHKKRSYTAAFKLHAVQRAMELESASQASLELDVSRRCLQRWKEELDLISSVAEHSSNAVYRRPGQGRKVHDITLDNQLLDWVRDSWKQGVNVSSGMIRDKARELSERDDFKASLGWYVKWQKRHNVDLKEQTCGSLNDDKASPLKLRLLPEGEVSCYSTPAKRRKTKKRRLSYEDEALLENDEEFDRLLLTWLVERWEAGDIVNDRMLKDRATELTSNPEFKASKAWITAWKRKYNVSLENQTYGNEGEEENEEIIEETEVYDNEVLLEDQHHLAQQQQQGGAAEGSENPITPTKEEAATTLASLSAEDHEAGLEIAEALQKLANAFGITAQVGEAAKEAMAQLTAAYQGDNPEFLLESGQVAVEEVVSEEVVTDEPMVVIEASGVELGDSTAPLSTSNVTPSANTPQTVAVTTTPTATPITTLAPASGGVQVDGLQAGILPASIQLTEASSSVTVQSSGTVATMVSTSPISSFVSEEVVISEPAMEASTSAVSGDSQVEVLVQEDGRIVLVSSQDAAETLSPDIIQAAAEIVQFSEGSVITTSSIPGPEITQAVVTTSTAPLIQAPTTAVNQATSIEASSVIPPVSTITTEVSTQHVADETVVQQSSSPSSLLQTSDSTTEAADHEIPIPVHTADILDIVTETLASSEKATEEVPTRRMYDEDFKAKVVSRAQELGSIQLAAREFSVPWRAVATWNTQEKEKE